MSDHILGQLLGAQNAAIPQWAHNSYQQQVEDMMRSQAQSQRYPVKAIEPNPVLLLLDAG